MAVISFDRVSKKFRRGQNHDSLRDLIPSLIRGTWRRRAADDLGAREFWALRDVSFEVEAGEALGIIGANGAGKSTTLKLLTRILKPTMGRAAIHGRTGALIEVAAGFHPELTGRENIFMQGAIMGMTRAEIRERFDEIVEFAGVSDAIDTPVKRYSSGMNARLGFSVAAHLRPAALVIDEVLAVGDMAFQQRCFDRMQDFKRQGVAIVLVSHNLQAVATLCDRAVYLAAGHMKATGPTAEVLDAYVRSSHGADHADSQSPVTLQSVQLLADGAPHAPADGVAPGTDMTLRVTGISRVPLDDATLGFAIHRSTDQLVLFHGHTKMQRLGPLPAGHRFAFDIRFRPHLVRGHYYLALQMIHDPTQELLIPRRQIATMVVSEATSRAGIVDVDFRVGRSDAAVGDGQAAASASAR